MIVLVVRAARVMGWIIFAGAVAVPLASLFITVTTGPSSAAGLAVSPRLAVIYLRTVLITASAAGLALVFALPACFALAHLAAGFTRNLLLGLVVLPLLTPPCVFGYAWMLLSSQTHAAGRLLTALGFNSTAAGPARAAVALANWIWPVPALILAASYRHSGRAAYRLARLDAPPLRAFFSAALPAMRGPLVAALAAAFVLAFNDATIPPLVLVHTWAAEIAPEVLDAALYGSPVAAMLWKSWPMIATLALVAVLALPGLRHMSDLAAADVTNDTGHAPLGAGGISATLFLVVAALSLFPIAVFATELYSARIATMESIRRCWTLYTAERNASLTVAALAALAALPLALTALHPALDAGGRSGRRQRVLQRASFVALACAMLLAALPPELIGHLLVRIFNRPGLLGRIYDDTPLVWLAAVLARYAFLSIAVGWLAAQQTPHDLIRQARTDGATGPEWLAAIGLPLSAPALAAAALVTGCLALCEVAASFIVIPARFGGSLAVAIDNQMHYGRNEDVILTTLMLLTPALVISIAVPFIFSRRGRKP